MLEPSSEDDSATRAAFEAALRNALEAASSEAPGELRRALCAHVRELRGQQVPPERMLVSVKATLYRLRVGRPDREHWRYGAYSADELVRQIIHLCIEEYYRAE